MTLEHYITAAYYIGICLWLVIFIYVNTSCKELLFDNDKKVNIARTDIMDIANLFDLAVNGKSSKVRRSASFHLVLLVILVLIPVMLFDIRP